MYFNFSPACRTFTMRIGTIIKVVYHTLTSFELMYNLQTIEFAGQILLVKLEPDQNVGGTNVKEGQKISWALVLSR